MQSTFADRDIVSSIILKVSYRCIVREVTLVGFRTLLCLKLSTLSSGKPQADVRATRELFRVPIF
jgi:hypothetical protein